MIALHLKRRWSTKVEVEENSDVISSLKHTTLMRFHALSSKFKLHLKKKAVFFCAYFPLWHVCRSVESCRFELTSFNSCLVPSNILDGIYYGRCRLTLKQRHSCHRERICRLCVWTSIYSSAGTIFPNLGNWSIL